MKFRDENNLEREKKYRLILTQHLILQINGGRIICFARVSGLTNSRRALAALTALHETFETERRNTVGPRFCVSSLSINLSFLKRSILAPIL